MKEFDPIESNAVHASMELTKQYTDQHRGCEPVEFAAAFAAIYAGVLQAINDGRK
jgi:hypothetical protein